MTDPPASVDPLIVTALLPDDVQQWFNDLRTRHFPSERNYLDAHVTLFHALPGDKIDEVHDALAGLAKRGEMALDIARVKSLGGGVAYGLDSPELMALRSELVTRWTEWLTPQDRHKRELHVTVQNKVAPEVARALRDELSKDFESMRTVCNGLALWHYRNGPWDHVADFRFG